MKLLFIKLILTTLGILFILHASCVEAKKKNHFDSNENKYKIVCYYTNWAQYRPKPGTFFPENVDPFLCTHIIFAFGKINANSELQSIEWNDESTDWSKGMYERLTALKQVNKDLKILIAVGGWNHGSMAFSNMARDDVKRNNFIIKAIDFLKKNKFDGLDIDWEYPASRDTEGRPDDQMYFTILSKELYEAFQPHKLILSAAVAAGIKTMKVAYDLPEIHKHLDFINLMAYDLNGAWDNVTGHNAPLYDHEFSKDKTLNVNFAVKEWLKYVPPEKLVLGLSSYGRSFKIREGFETCPITDTPASAPGTSGKFSREDGFLTYYEVCDKLRNNNWKYVWSEEQKVPFAYSKESHSSISNPLEWVGFDDVKSIEIKSKYIIKNNLGGGMIWSLDMDDFTGEYCNQGKYPILTVMNHYLRPGSGILMPKADILWKFEAETTEPDYESKYIVSAKKLTDTPSADFFSSNNMFGLIENNALQIYKFCQCKNGTHKINSESNKLYSFSVDCNKKKVRSLSSLNEEENDETLDEANAEHKSNADSTENSNYGSTLPTEIEKNIEEKEPEEKKQQVHDDDDDDENEKKTNENFKIVCHLTDLFNTREGLANLTTDKIDQFNLCTHIVFSFGLADNKLYDLIRNDSFASLISIYDTIKSLKEKNKLLKILLSVGNYNQRSVPFFEMWLNPFNRRAYIRNTVRFLLKNNLDGLDINWSNQNINSNKFNQKN